MMNPVLSTTGPVLQVSQSLSCLTGRVFFGGEMDGNLYLGLCQIHLSYSLERKAQSRYTWFTAA